MITMMMQGGLGNQLFQYATGYAIAKKLGVELALDISNYKHDSLRRFNLDLFKIENKIVFDSRPTWVENDLTYQAMHVADGSVLLGYFQCEKYFAEYREELKQIFTPRQFLPFGYGNYYDKIMQSYVPVAVTIRRGDYLQKQDFHGVLGAKYYQRAILHIDALNHKMLDSGIQLFVFSDDIEWCKQNFLAPNDRITIIYIQNDMTTPSHMGREDADIFLMKNCRHQILANSTFGWWGAWLSESEAIITPHNWFANGMAHDIVPERWTRI